jgi:anti-sigma factor RsiW
MNPCPDRHETLLLDVYGELASSERPAWDTHLEICAGCRSERRELVRLLEATRESMGTVALSPAKARSLRESIAERWRPARSTRWWQELLLGVRLRPVSALTAVGILLLAVGWFGFREFHLQLLKDRRADTRGRIMVSDREVVENLDILEQMDDIERVVKVVDHRNIAL